MLPHLKNHCSLTGGNPIRHPAGGFAFIRPPSLLLAFILPAMLLMGVSCRSVNVSADSAMIRFGIMTDAHYADAEPRIGRHYRDSIDKVRECVRIMNRDKVDFLVNLGDFVDGSSGDNILRDIKTVEAEFRKFNGPRYHVLGNHCMDRLSKAEFLDQVEITGIPKGRPHYAFVQKDILFLVLDPNFKSDGMPYERSNYNWTDANIPDEQLAWMKDTLSKHDGRAIVFLHQQLCSDGAPTNVRNAPAVRKILSESGKVLAVFCGHHHEGGMKTMDGIHYYTLKGMVEGAGMENNSFAIVEIKKDYTIRIIGFYRATSAELSSPER